MKNVEELKNVKNKIRTVSPIFTDEVMNLLHEFIYLTISEYNSFDTFLQDIETNESLNRLVQSLCGKELHE